MDAHQQQIRDEKLRQWEPIIDQCDKEWEEYGSKAAWCRAHDVAISIFYYWRGIIFGLRGIPSQAKPKKEPEPGVTADDFVDVTSVVNSYDSSGHSGPSEQRSPGTAPEIMMECRKCRVYLYSSVHRETLAMLAEVLHVC